MSDTEESWYENGKRHREDGPALIERKKRSIRYYWYNRDRLNRKDGPAITLDHNKRSFNQHIAYEWWVMHEKANSFDDWIRLLTLHYGDEHAMLMKIKWANKWEVEKYP